MYIFPTALNPSFKVFLKSRKLKQLIMSPKTLSTLALTRLIAVLNSRCSGVRCNPLNGGHHRCIKDCLRESVSKAVTVATSQNQLTYHCLSWHLPSTGTYKLAISPLGITTDCNFIAWTLLCPLYKVLYNVPGLQTGLTVPSTNPQQ